MIVLKNILKIKAKNEFKIYQQIEYYIYFINKR